MATDRADPRHGRMPVRPSRPGRERQRFLKTTLIEESVSEQLARRAARLRRLSGSGSAVDALVVAAAEPGGTVLTGDRADIEALAAHANGVGVELV